MPCSGLLAACGLSLQGPASGPGVSGSGVPWLCAEPAVLLADLVLLLVKSPLYRWAAWGRGALGYSISEEQRSPDCPRSCVPSAAVVVSAWGTPCSAAPQKQHQWGLLGVGSEASWSGWAQEMGSSSRTGLRRVPARRSPVMGMGCGLGMGTGIGQGPVPCGQPSPVPLSIGSTRSVVCGKSP